MAHVLRTAGRWLTTLALAVLAMAAVAAMWLVDRVQLDTAGAVDFVNPLTVPPPLEPRTEPDGTKVFDLTLRAGRSELLPGASTETWGVNGSYLGPTLRARRGDDVRVRVANRLADATTLHWHGMHVPGAMDGGPHQVIEPGAVWEPAWRIDQPAAALWYHAHLHHHTAQHVYRGLAGLFILDDDEADGLALPHRYGVDDIPLVVQDKAFDEDGSLADREGPANTVGVLGDEVLVNGTPSPYLQVRDRRVRLRLLNASNARVYNFGFDDDRRFALIATDSGLLDAPVELHRLQLSPGERVEIVVDLVPGERTTLRSYPPDLGMNALLERTNGGGDTLDVLLLRADDQLRDAPPVPDVLASVDHVDAEDATNSRSFELGGFSRINDREMALHRVDEHITDGATEIWTIHNASNIYHNFHVHLVRFRVLDVDGQAPPDAFTGWKDTVFLPPGTTVRIIARFDSEPDPDSPFMFHCHILAHEDAGMMGQFVITRAPPGDAEAALRQAGGGKTSAVPLE